MNSRNTLRGQAGFTIIELMIATMIFTVILLIVTAGILQFNKQYYKGVIASTTQDAARTLIDDLTRSMQFNGGTFATLTGDSEQSGGYCVGGGKRYSYQLNRQVENNPISAEHQGYHGLVTDTVTACEASTPPVDVPSLPSNLASATPALNNPRELLGQHMRLAKFSIVPTGDLYVITVRVVFGDDDLLCSPSKLGDCADTTPTGAIDDKTDLTCRASIGSSYCAVSELTTTVMKRVK